MAPRMRAAGTTGFEVDDIAWLPGKNASPGFTLHLTVSVLWLAFLHSLLLYLCSKIAQQLDRPIEIKTSQKLASNSNISIRIPLHIHVPQIRAATISDCG